MNSLSVDQITAILNEAPKRSTATPQIGPLRYTEDERRCTKRGCSSPTYCTVQGSPKCATHALEELNEMLVSAGFKGVVTSHSSSPTTLPTNRVCSTSVRSKLEIGWVLNRFECIHGINLDKSCKVCNGEEVERNSNATSAARINA